MASLAILGALVQATNSHCSRTPAVGAALGLLGAKATLAILGALRRVLVGNSTDAVPLGATLGLLGAKATLAILGALVRYPLVLLDQAGVAVWAARLRGSGSPLARFRPRALGWSA